MSTSIEKDKQVDLTAPYANDSKLNKDRVRKNSAERLPIVQGMKNSSAVSTGAEVVQEHRKFG